MKVGNEWWRLSLEARWVKNRPPIYERENCICTSKFFNMYPDDVCSKCNGSGIIQKEVAFPKPPKIPDSLIQHLTKSYQEWCEQNLELCLKEKENVKSCIV